MKKRAFTLLEIMIAILLITLITGAIGYNMRGTLDKGKAFRTRQAQEQLRDLLLICMSEDTSADAITKEPEKCLKKLGLAKDPKKLLVDGWGEPFKITVEGTEVTVESEQLKLYEKKH